MEPNSRRSNNGQRRFYSSNHQTTSYSSSSSSFASSTSQLLHRSTSPTRVSVFNSVAKSAQSVRFTLDRRSSSPNRFVSVSSNQNRNRNQNEVMSRKPAGPSQTKRTCACSPTTHPGSFRCGLHRNSGSSCVKTASFGCNKLERSAMANSLVRIGAVEGDLVKRALAALIRPSSHQLRRRQNFQRRPSRLSVMSKANNS